MLHFIIARRGSWILLAALPLTAAACGEPARSVAPPPGAPSLARASAAPGGQDRALLAGLAALRGATAKYHVPAVATADGYAGPPVCMSSPDGAMGVHLANWQLLGDAAIDPLRPEVLLYAPAPDGTHRLVGVEFVVFKAAWDAVNPAPPTFHGVPYDEMVGPEAHGIPDHYELHVWLWRHNPAGMFARWNPKVSCG